MPLQGSLRISKEVTDLQKGSDLSLAAAFREDDVRKVRALIIGPPDTPYEFGFFEFQLVFCEEYPIKAPNVTCMTTNLGRTRFNPNIYAGGKVCFTWRGENGEQWSTAQGLESILISIQSLMSANPYENEPGFENCKEGEEAKAASAYAAKIRHETLRISVIERLERIFGLNQNQTLCQRYAAAQQDDFSPFEDLYKRRFLWYYDTYLHRIREDVEKYGDQVEDGKTFNFAPFESRGNGMSGKYQYPELTTRLKKLKERIDQETASWIVQGAKAVERESPLSLSFQQKYTHICDDLRRRQVPVEVQLIDNNPFHWSLTLFGRPTSNLDGGIFKIRVCFSVRFPEQEQPRATVETPIFHQRVSKEGVLCYTPEKPNDVASHIDSIIQELENETPFYDPRTLVNVDAAKLLWGSAEDKKRYNSKLRRSARDSAEL